MSNDTVLNLMPEFAPDGWNDDMKAIWDIYEQAKIIALKKNHSYGSSVFKTGVLSQDLPVDSAIRVRMGDKIARLQILIAHQEKSSGIEENIDDAVLDLAGYCLLLLIARERAKKNK